MAGQGLFSARWKDNRGRRSDAAATVSVLSLAELLPFILIGFAAQLVDGAIGMAFGVISSTMLTSLVGLPPATASASVHLVATFTTGMLAP